MAYYLLLPDYQALLDFIRPLNCPENGLVVYNVAIYWNVIIFVLIHWHLDVSCVQLMCCWHHVAMSWTEVSQATFMTMGHFPPPRYREGPAFPCFPIEEGLREEDSSMIQSVSMVMKNGEEKSCVIFSKRKIAWPFIWVRGIRVVGVLWRKGRLSV